MRTGQRIAVGLIGGFVILSLLVIMSVLILLPNPTWIGERLRSPRTEIADSTSVTPKASTPVKSEKLEPPTGPTTKNAGNLTATQPESSAPPINISKNERRRLVSERFIDRYLLETRIQTTVCENLDHATAPFQTAEEFGKQIEGSLLGESKPSAATEAVMLPIEFILKNDAVRDLVQSAKNAADRGDTGVLQKAQFYAQAARATASVLNSQDEFETISGHAYRLYAISRAAALKPEILQDPDTNDLCRGIERSAVDGLERDIVFDQERLMRLLGRHGIDPASIDYNPKTSMQLQVIREGGSMQIKMPWLDQVFKKRE